MATNQSNTAGVPAPVGPTASAGQPIAPGQGGGAVVTKKIKNTKTHNLPGKRVVKEYPITEDVLTNIGSLRLSAAFWAAVGSLALGFAVSAWMSIDLAGTDVKREAVAAWKAYRNLSAVFALFSYLSAAWYFYKGKSVIQYVKESTTHDPVD